MEVKLVVDLLSILFFSLQISLENIFRCWRGGYLLHRVFSIWFRWNWRIWSVNIFVCIFACSQVCMCIYLRVLLVVKNPTGDLLTLAQLAMVQLEKVASWETKYLQCNSVDLILNLTFKVHKVTEFYWEWWDTYLSFTPTL